MPGIDNPSAVPQVLPVALMRIGSIAVLGIPGELTTTAGRRLRTTVLDVMSGSGVRHVALGTYANEYAQYITTLEEYSSQQYEGASTLFGLTLSRPTSRRRPRSRRRSVKVMRRILDRHQLLGPPRRNGAIASATCRALRSSSSFTTSTTPCSGSRSPTARRRSLPVRRLRMPSESSPGRRRCRRSRRSRFGSAAPSSYRWLQVSC
jgi:Neutral/alkaline non-lysosomal ceramidase, N-terminal